MLVDPTPCSLKNLDAWGTFWARVGLLSAANLETIARELCRSQENAYSPLAASVRQQLNAGRADDGFARELIRIALWLGDLTAYVSYPTKKIAFAVEPTVWDVMALGYHDARRSLEDGIFAINGAKYPANTIERELANRPLFVNRGVANRWLRIRPPSGAQQCKIAKAIIKHHKDRHGVQPMRKADFVTAAVDALPGLTRHRAEQLWGDHALEEWKKAGTKKGN